MSYEVKQSSWPHSTRKGYWVWEAWIEATEAEMARVTQVHYLLHQTFPNPHRIVTDPENGFRVRSAGWGEFNIVVIIDLDDGSTVEIDHWLTLGEGVVLETVQPGAKVFLTYAASDADAGAEAKADLAAKGFDVSTSDDLPVGIPWEMGLRNLVDDAELVVAIVPRTDNAALNHDLELAKERSKEIVPVVIETRGGSDLVLDGLRDKVHLKEPSEIAEMVTQRIKR